MIKIEFDTNIKSKFTDTKVKISHEHTNTFEVELLISELFDLIKQNDKTMTDKKIIKDILGVLRLKKEIKKELKK